MSKIKKVYSYNSETITKLKKASSLKKVELSKLWCSKRNILILGQGESVNSDKEKIIEFAKKNKCIILSLNINRYIQKNLVKSIY